MPGNVKTVLETGTKIRKSISSAYDIGSGTGDLYHIGKPVRFLPLVDQGNRISDYIKNKMNIIDFIPCDYSIQLIKSILEGSADALSKEDFFNDIVPKVTYKKSIERFKKITQSYGLKPVAGLRVYTTDETIATDEFRNQFDNNIISSAINTGTKLAKQFKSMGQSVSSQTMQAFKNATQSGISTTVGSLVSLAGGGEAAQKTTQHLIELAQDILLTGKNISLPKVWDSSSYTPNTSIVVKLMSPYGSPKAIKQFIIKPLTYLLLLSLPRTTDGIAYGYPPLVTIKAYGMTDISLGAIQGITMRRGGNDTSFNIYKQPLTIDLSIEIINLIDGCASMDVKTNEEKFEDQFEATSFQNSDKQVTDTNVYQVSNTTLLQTPGKIIRSLSPIGITPIVAENYGLDGEFINPPKDIDVDLLYANNELNKTTSKQTKSEPLKNEQTGIIMTQSESFESQQSGVESSKDMADREASDFDEELVLASMYDTTFA